MLRPPILKAWIIPVLLLACSSAARPQYIRDWLVLGTFANDVDSTRLTRDYLHGDSLAAPRGGREDGGKRWILYHSPVDHLDFLDPDLPFAPREHCAAYAAFFVKSPSDRRVRLMLGSDDGVMLRCNGKMVHFNDVYRGLQPDEDTVDIPLNAGWNTLVFKVTNGEGGYALSVRLINASDLSIQAESPFALTGSVSPARIELPSSAPAFDFELSESNSAEALIEFGLTNSGETEADDVSASIGDGRETIADLHLPRILPGELFRVRQAIPFEKALSIEIDTQLVVRIRNAGRDTACTYATRGLLSRIFSDWTLPGWRESGTGALRSASRTVAVPADVTGLGLEFTVDIGDVWASVSINGKEVLRRFSGDSGDIELTASSVPGDTFHIVIEAESLKAASSKLIQSSVLKVRNKDIERYLADVRFARDIYHIPIGDQSSVTADLLSDLRDHHADRIADALKDVDRVFSAHAPEAKRLSLSMIGNSHIDMAWLWRYTETIDVVKRTFEAALDNLRRYPDFTFSHGQAQSYAWMETLYPDLFAEVQKYVKAGRWEIVGGTWVESDANMPSGESLVRQYLYGKRYFKKKFGVEVKHGWYPDTFGHAASLPQILAKSGIETYTFFRPWEEERIFWWEGLDGSRVFAHRPPNWYGTWSGIPDTVCMTAIRSNAAAKITDAARFFGVGDHGGGPTRREIAAVHRLGGVDLYPAIAFSTFDAYYGKLEKEKSDAPVTKGEQNFVFDGCYTSQAMVKRNNRKAEALLPTAEMFSAIASRYGYRYPSDSLEDAWHKVLFNQVHDVMCGSGIHDIYTDAKKFYDDAFRKADDALNGALGVLTSRIRTLGRDRKAMPIVIFNPLNWPVTAPVVVPLRAVGGAGKVPKIVDAAGKEIASEVVRWTNDSVECRFVPAVVPPVGFKTFWVEWKKEQAPRSDGSLDLENNYLKVTIDGQTGAVSRIYDKVARRDIVQEGAQANQLQLQDDDAPMSAWVIGLKGIPGVLRSASSVEVLEDGPVRKAIRSTYRFGRSTVMQDIILYRDLPRLDFSVAADWHERKKILKIVFPLLIPQSNATFDIPYGSITRAADGRELVTQKWMDLSSAEYGVTLTNDSKYGCSVRGDTMMLTALRSPTDPDPHADEGSHYFSYALMPHSGSWKHAGVVRSAFEFNTPMIPFATTGHEGSLPPEYSFFRIESPDVVVTALKKCEDDDALILRCYETAGDSARASTSAWLPIDSVSETNLMEWNPRRVMGEVRAMAPLVVPLAPFEIKTLKLAIGRSE